MPNQQRTMDAKWSGQFTTGLGAVLSLVTLAMTGCSKNVPESAPTPVVRPAIIQEVGATDSSASSRFPGRLRAAKRAELSFNVPGFVAEFNLSEGTRVQAGQVVARLDDAVFKARVNATQAEFDRAKIDLERYQRLWETEQAVARSEVDDRRSRLEVARTNLAAAQQDLADTRIKAPFSGVVTRRRLETFANVQAKQAIAELQDLSSLEVVIHVPQRLLRNQGSQSTAMAFFEEHEDQPVPVTLKSYATEADPQTQTYEIVLTLKSRPPGLTLLPGMSVTVLPFSGKSNSVSPALSIPLTAIATDATGDKFVWVVGNGGQVARANVVLGAVRGGQIAVVSGLNAKQRIVTAGVSALREGMQVRPLDVR
ncbi:MAG: efflux RND transporter periplasmic adaptor subunit [Rhodoferax sp.]|uniref:efflux RND transporter periplasmic adaptor subunit n=1 Tax=Rhodoferax sp. TaxID=50421 RepID=UPI001B4BF104|nr:efflux RND transporter periplasmic adaptor subunit [Rhodoferax sp.]MBP9906985.1 efflux RND transporter periplasmic adaptor subunit [Rhodoferax sp.]